MYLGVFDRAAIEAVGLFDERLIRNQDYELNIRLRKAGGTVVFDPELWVGYTPRGSWKALAKQYFEYGQWKAEVLRLHPDSLKLRQMVPPVAVIGVIASVLLAPRRAALALPATLYALAVLAATRRPVNGPRSWTRRFGVQVTVHFTWTAGLLGGVLRPGIAEPPERPRRPHHV